MAQVNFLRDGAAVLLDIDARMRQVHPLLELIIAQGSVCAVSHLPFAGLTLPVDFGVKAFSPRQPAFYSTSNNRVTPAPAIFTGGAGLTPGEVDLLLD